MIMPQASIQVLRLLPARKAVSHSVLDKLHCNSPDSESEQASALRSRNSKMQYSYLEIQQNEFRLLKLHQSSTSPVCELAVFSRSEAPLYHAISYCWGSETPTESIYCNDKALLVTKNLLAGLRELSQHRLNPRSAPTWFWIDAICINQVDDVEKATQVQAMGDIFSSASSVLVWLGSASDDSDLAMDQLPKMLDRMSEIEFIPARKRTNAQQLVDVGLPSVNNPIWHAIFRLYDRAWFRRG